MSYSSKMPNNLFAHEYSERVGYMQKRKLYECVAAGDLEHLESVMDEYFDGVSSFVGDDLDLACESMRWMYIQMNAYVTMEHLTDTQARDIQKGYFVKLEEVQTVPEVYETSPCLVREYAAEIAKRKQEDRFSPLVKKIRHYVKTHIYNRLTVADVAEAVHFSKNYVSRKFKEETGVTLEKYIRTKKIEEAKCLLEAGMSVMDVAVALEFASQGHFSDTFRSEVGVTPKKFQKKRI